MVFENQTKGSVDKYLITKDKSSKIHIGESIIKTWNYNTNSNNM